MAIRNIVKVDDPLLREVSRNVTVFDDRLGVLIDDMIETMRREDGAGIAAVQVGVLRRICIVSPDGEKIYEVVNPEVLEQRGTQISAEGCLSIPNAWEEVKRPYYIKVKAFDRFGKECIVEAEGRLAVIFCHELDHLDGVLFTDRAES